ncbi:NAD(P)H-dependent flavin oxidoreductase YrpB (nitropropane dioxygenase family) [Sinorhizobium terangae]|uniref:hypothetical protein n=1 Tax=Sinorhizobium terangae TaxID=110322 RepID=UPI001827BA11|nr:hypothetical protein [Sinorhizobium terangae]MBB4188652.1 NAD(P)H-dependent flavin oxidoreductase YrpB (nitropropane dioxygenase family) [Sinorhizobium terangae]
MATIMHNNAFRKLGLKHPLIVAPMAGGPSSPELVAAASAVGALGQPVRLVQVRRRSKNSPLKFVGVPIGPSRSTSSFPPDPPD